MSDKGLVTVAGRTLRAELMANIFMPGGPANVLALSWFAVGDANNTWVDVPPTEDGTVTGLIHEIARKQIQRAAFLVPDPAGSLLYNNQHWSESVLPTPVVAFFTSFLDNELQGATILEEAIFGGHVETSASPIALPGEVILPGVCYWIRNRGIFVKNPRTTFTGIAIFEETV